MRPLTQVKAFDYSGAPSLGAMGEIQVTTAAPEFADAIVAAIELHGGKARRVSRPDPGGTCILTEALGNGGSARRHHGVLEALLLHQGRTVVLDFARAGHLDSVGGCAGLCRSVRIERPDARAHVLSLHTEEPRSGAQRVVHALTEADGDYELKADGGWRDLPGAELLPPGRAPALPHAPIWLVTGGARGVTADCAIELARRTGGTFLLLGRSAMTDWPDWLPPTNDLKTLRGILARNASRPGMPKKPADIDRLGRQLLAGAEIRATMDAITQAGARARYVQADISSPSDLARALSDAQQVAGTITGLVHGAGVLSDGRAEALSAEDFETVFAPKVLGLEAVLSCLDAGQLSHIGLFSSASAVFGNTGQANYAAANAWLNNVALSLAETLPEAQVKSFCWGPWQGGMVDEALARMFTERGIGLIARPEGARILADLLLASPREQVRFVIGDEWAAS